MNTKFSGMLFFGSLFAISWFALTSPCQAEAVVGSSSADQSVEGSIWYDAEQGKIKPI